MVDSVEVDDYVGGHKTGNKKRCNLFDGNRDANGLCLLLLGNAIYLNSTLFLGSSLLWLAKDAAGCFGDEAEIKAASSNATSTSETLSTNST